MILPVNRKRTNMATTQENNFSTECRKLVDSLDERTRLLALLCHDTEECLNEMFEANRLLRDWITEDVRFNITKRWSVQKQEDKLEQVRLYQVDPPSDLDEELIDVHMQVVWPIMERELVWHLKPENRKEPPQQTAQEIIAAEMERYMDTLAQEVLKERVQKQLDGKASIQPDDWWKTKEDMKIVIEEIEQNLASETPLQAPPEIREAQRQARFWGMVSGFRPILV